ncbi:unnamed protein product [Paramecium primaurelia]|uniref:Katanin p80 subunit C-terminal domain-containing protein n=1 Tax=Paramecium primaurelia TaxID=5886 RepID=A0A8S1P6M1_PARPR|nr:unnamed protein product [Paramecium primaurelia]
MKQNTIYDYQNESQIICCKFSLNQNQFISVNEKNIFLWSEQVYQPLMTLSNSAKVSCIQFSQQNNLILEGTQQGKILILNLEQQIQQEIKSSHKDVITNLTNYDINTYLSGSQDSVIMIHDLRQNGPIAQIKQHKQQINDIVTDLDTFRFICGSQDATISVWDFRNYSQYQALLEHQDSVNNLLMIKNTNTLFTSGDKFTIQSWDINKQTQKNRISLTQQPIQKMAFDYQQDILICTQQNNLDIFNTELLQLNTMQMDWQRIKDIKIEDDIVKILEDRGEILKLHKFQLELNGLQVEDNYTDIKDIEIPFSQQMQFDQCFYPSQSKENFDQSYEQEDQISDDIITTQKLSLKFSQLIQTKSNKDKYIQLEIIQEISNDHSKIKMILNDRIQKLKPIIKLYSQNDMKQCIQQINRCNDNSVLIDLFALLKLDPAQRKIQAEDIILLLENVIIILNSKYTYQVIKGLEFIKFCFYQIKDNILSYKTAKKQPQNKAQDKNQIRQKSYDTLILQFDKIMKLPKLNKLLQVKDTNLVNLTSQIKNEISQFLNKLE